MVDPVTFVLLIGATIGTVAWTKKMQQRDQEREDANETHSSRESEERSTAMNSLYPTRPFGLSGDWCLTHSSPEPCSSCQALEAARRFAMPTPNPTFVSNPISVLAQQVPNRTLAMLERENELDASVSSYDILPNILSAPAVVERAKAMGDQPWSIEFEDREHGLFFDKVRTRTIRFR